MVKACGLLAALVLALAACGGEATAPTPTPAPTATPTPTPAPTATPCADCVNLSGEGQFMRDVALLGGRYACRAEVSRNAYLNADGERVEAEAKIVIAGIELVYRGEWRRYTDKFFIINESAAAAAVAGEGEAGYDGYTGFGARTGNVTVAVQVEPYARWSLACDPVATP